MSGRLNTNPKISLSLLKTKSAGQSVPSMSYRFNASADNVIEISDTEEVEDESALDTRTETNPPAELSVCTRSDLTRDPSPLKDICNRSFSGRRSSSLDENSGPPGEGAKEGNLFSRITRKVEDIQDKFSRKQHEKRDRELRVDVTMEEGSQEISPCWKDKKNIFDVFQRDEEPETKVKGKNHVEVEGKGKEKGHGDTEGKGKGKVGLVQEIKEHTAMLRHRLHKSAVVGEGKDGKESKHHPFHLASLLGRSEGMTGDESLLVDDETEVDKAVEAQESDLFPIFPDSEGIPCEAQATNSILKQIGPHKNADCYDALPSTPRQKMLQIMKGCPLSLGTSAKIFFVVIVLCLVLPKFLSGFVLGVSIAGVAAYCLLRLMIPHCDETVVDKCERRHAPVLLDLINYEDKQVYKGWLNELEGEYVPGAYHVSDTHSVLVRLEGTKLLIDHPRGKVPKHARVNEEIRTSKFAHHREYNIAGCQVLLLPKNLPRRWLWSRKYPICIRLQREDTLGVPTPSWGGNNDSPFGSCQGTPIKTRFHQDFSHHDILSKTEVLDLKSVDKTEDVMTASVDLNSFEEVTEEMCLERTLHLFARTDREKDDWFRRLVAAAATATVTVPPTPYKGTPLSTPQEGEVASPTEEIPSEKDSPTEVTINFLSGCQEDENPPCLLPSDINQDMSFEKYMAILLCQSQDQSQYHEGQSIASVAWLNTLAGRIFYDFLRNPYWANKVQERVQRKLGKVKVPYFIGELVVCGVDLGTCVPQIKWVGPPQVDSRGLWVDMTVEYSGGFTLSLETKLDLMKLKRTAGSQPAAVPPSPGQQAGSSTPIGVGDQVPTFPFLSSSPLPTPSLPNNPSTAFPPTSINASLSKTSTPQRWQHRDLQFDTDTDDSLESTSEDEPDEELPAEGSSATSKRLLRLVDSVAGSKYFQQASEWKLLQRAFKGVSNTRIVLTVEVRRVAGTLALNVPPPPADRIWYGFRTYPELLMVARPKVGDREISFPLLVDFIQKQLETIFEKVFVLPNMDDLIIPIMSPLLPGQHQVPRPPWDTRAEVLPCGSNAPPTASVSFHVASQL